MKDPEYRAEYYAAEPQYELITALLDARAHADIDQDELAARMGIHVTAVMRLEGWKSNPSVKTLRPRRRSHRHQTQNQLRAR